MIFIYCNNIYKVFFNFEIMTEQDKKQEYIAKRDEFKKKKEGLLEQKKIFGDSPLVKDHYILLSKKRLEEIAQNKK